MLDSLPLYLLLAGIGVATGTLTGLTGASGMSILISLLLLAGVDVREVIGLTFVVTLVNAIGSAGPYLKHGNVDRRLATWVGVPATLAVLVGHQLAGAVRPGVLSGVLVVFLGAAGVRFLTSSAEPPATNLKPDRRPPGWVLAALGAVIGLVMGMMGGGGAIFIGAIFILFFRLPARLAIGTSVVIMGLAALPGVIVHVLSGTLRWDYATAIVLPSLPASWASSRWAHRIRPTTVRRCLGGYLVVISIVLAAKYLLATD
jgi:uncharacterized membrane protein YfcA